MRRVADESDGRASRLVLTDAGRAQLDQLRAERVAYLRTVTADWTDEELETLASDLSSLPAGGSALGTIGVVFIVLLVLELVGVIDIFKKI